MVFNCYLVFKTSPPLSSQELWWCVCRSASRPNDCGCQPVQSYT